MVAWSGIDQVSNHTPHRYLFDTCVRKPLTHHPHASVPTGLSTASVRIVKECKLFAAGLKDLQTFTITFIIAYYNWVAG